MALCCLVVGFQVSDLTGGASWERMLGNIRAAKLVSHKLERKRRGILKNGEMSPPPASGEKMVHRPDRQNKPNSQIRRPGPAMRARIAYCVGWIGPFHRPPKSRFTANDAHTHIRGFRATSAT